LSEKAFLEIVVSRIKAVYLRHAPGGLRTTKAKIDSLSRVLCLEFYTNHPRGTDEIYLRSISNHISVDFSPGARLPLCLFDEGGIRWLCMDVPTTLTKVEKTDVENITRAIYGLAQEKKALLQLVLKDIPTAPHENIIT
jgi:hypothetical protein